MIDASPSLCAAAVVYHVQALGIGGDGDAGSKGGVEPGKLIHQYGLQFARSAPEVALEYFMLASQALGNDKLTKARLLRELLTESNAFGYLLGSGGSQGGTLILDFASMMKTVYH